jgi:hypothetical protein
MASLLRQRGGQKTCGLASSGECSGRNQKPKRRVGLKQTKRSVAAVVQEHQQLPLLCRESPNPIPHVQGPRIHQELTGRDPAPLPWS